MLVNRGTKMWPEPARFAFVAGQENNKLVQADLTNMQVNFARSIGESLGSSELAEAFRLAR